MNTSYSTLPVADTSPSLLRRTALLPGESLASLLARLARLNFYPNSRLLQTISRDRLAPMRVDDKLAQPHRLETFQQLVNLTQLTLDELYGASDQRFAILLEAPGQAAQTTPWLENTTRLRLDRRSAPAHLRSTVATQFCPLCLKTEPYHRLSWTPRATAICLEHLCLLTDRCARCWKRTTVADLVNRRCSNCRADLRRARVVSIAHDSCGILAQQVIQSWFGVVDIPAKVIEGAHLPPESPLVLYRLLQLLARQLQKGQAEWPNLPRPLNGLANSIAASIEDHRCLTPEQIYFLYRSAFVGLRDWPEGLCQFLDAYGGCDPASRAAPVRIKCLQQVQHDWLAVDWHDSPLAFVQPVLVDYLLQRRLPFLRAVAERFSAVAWFTEQTGLWTEGHTAQALGISLHDLQRFYPRGSLAKCFKPDPRTRLPMFKRDAVLAVQRRWATGWSLEDVSSWLGLEIADVLRLVQLGLLKPLGGRETTAEVNQVFDRHGVAAFFEQVDRRLKVYPGTRYYLATLDEAAREFSSCGLDRAALLQGVARGVLPGYKYQPNIHSLRQVRFVETQLLALPDLSFAERGWVAEDRFTQEKQVTSRTIQNWIDAGWISPVATLGRQRYFWRKELEVLLQQDRG